MKKAALRLLSLSLIILFLFLSTPPRSQASIISCGGSFSPSNLNVNVTNQVTATVSNGDPQNNIVWIKITVSSSNYEILSANGSGWSTSIQSPTEVIFRSGSISSGASANFNLSVYVGTNVSSTSWTVQTSDDQNGNNSSICSGNINIGIGNDTSSPVVSNISVSNITYSSAVITWTTSEQANSSVEYGQSSSYGSTAATNSTTTSHSLSLTGLSSNTTYHYKAKSVDSSGNIGESSDNTFLTSTAPPGAPPPPTTPDSIQTLPPESSPSPTTGTTTTPTPSKIKPPDTLAPSITVTTDFSKPFSSSPKISGSATDESGVKSISFSTDDGRNWLPMETVSNLGKSPVEFSFTPKISEEGNYLIKIRADDFKGNRGVSETFTLVIDRLPPQIGGNLISVGPQVITPNDQGTIIALIGMDQKITLSAIGGPTKIDLLSQSQDSSSTSEQVFSLTKNIDTGLWSGVLNFQSPGIYNLKVKSIDGAQKTTERVLTQVNVLESGKVIGSSGQLKDAEVSLFYFEPTMNQYVFWNGSPFSQTNPQKTDENGRFRLLIPSGKYFLQVNAPTYQKLTTQIFEIDKVTPITDILTLTKGQIWGLNFLTNLFDLLKPKLPLNFLNPTTNPVANLNTLIGQKLPQFSYDFEGNKISPETLLGKPTLASILNTWSPLGAEQIGVFEDLPQSSVSSLIILPHESASSVEVFRKRGNYQSTIVSDPEGKIVESLNYQSIPMHLFVDSTGIVRKIKIGVLSKDEILQNLVR